MTFGDRKEPSSDGDYRYDPKQFRRTGNAMDEFSPPNRRRPTYGSGLKNLAIWIVIGAFLTLAFQTFVVKPKGGILGAAQNASASALPELSLPQKCAVTTMPANGAVKVDRSSVMNRSDAIYSGIHFDNLHNAALMATLTELNTGNTIASVFIHPGKSAELSAPVGQYGLQFAWGLSWCDSTFADAHLVNVRSGLLNQQGETTKITISTAAEHPSGLSFNLERIRPQVATAQPTAAYPQPVAPQIQGQGMVLAADPLGHYRVNGTINGRPVRFLLDTGASFTSISRRVANEAGIYNCHYGGRSQTANGTIDRCQARAGSMSFGTFRIDNVDVNILDNSEGDALLGMNVLRHFALEQTNGRLRLSPAQ